MASARRVLIVEDNPSGRETLRLVLEMWGHQVEVAADGLQGVQKALKWQPDVAIIDIGLPIFNGHEVARQVRAALDGKIRLIALTAYSQERNNAFQVGFDHFMTKPAELDELAEWIVENGGEEATASGGR
jgi:CheY-like chemotaxis protein